RLLSFSFDRCGHPRDLHSFPTRRSSDLSMAAARAVSADEGRPASGWEPVQLPDIWVKRWPDFEGTVWYRIDWDRVCQTEPDGVRSEEHTSELQSRENLVCRLLLEKKKKP